MAKKAKKTTAHKFPKQVFVRWEADANDDDGGYLVVDETPDDASDAESVAIYELRQTRRMKITRELT